MTASVGELSPATVTGVTLDAMTASTGSVVIEYKFPVTGLSVTASLGTITAIDDQVVGVSSGCYDSIGRNSWNYPLCRY